MEGRITITGHWLGRVDEKRASRRTARTCESDGDYVYEVFFEQQNGHLRSTDEDEKDISARTEHHKEQQ